MHKQGREPDLRVQFLISNIERSVYGKSGNLDDERRTGIAVIRVEKKYDKIDSAIFELMHVDFPMLNGQVCLNLDVFVMFFFAPFARSFINYNLPFFFFNFISHVCIQGVTYKTVQISPAWSAKQTYLKSLYKLMS